MHHSDFVHLHTHTQYSLLDGMLRLDELMKRAAECEMPAVAMTDHGNMFGAVDFYKKALKAGLKPIPGCEVYVAPESRFDRKSNRGISDTAFHLILLIKNKKGYQNLAKPATAGFLEGFYYRPRIDKEILAQHSEGLIALSACMKGEVSNLIMKENMESAVKVAREYNRSRVDRFLLPLQVEVCFLCLPPGFPAAPQYFNHTPVGPGPSRNRTRWTTASGSSNRFTNLVNKSSYTLSGFLVSARGSVQGAC